MENYKAYMAYNGEKQILEKKGESIPSFLLPITPCAPPGRAFLVNI